MHERPSRRNRVVVQEGPTDQGLPTSLSQCLGRWVQPAAWILVRGSGSARRNRFRDVSRTSWCDPPCAFKHEHDAGGQDDTDQHQRAAQGDEQPCQRSRGAGQGAAEPASRKCTNAQENRRTQNARWARCTSLRREGMAYIPRCCLARVTAIWTVRAMMASRPRSPRAMATGRRRQNRSGLRSTNGSATRIPKNASSP